MHRTVAQEGAPDPEPPVAAATALAPVPATTLRSLQRGAGNRAVARLVGPALRELRFRSLIGAEAAQRGQMLFHAKVGDMLFPKVEAAIENEPGLKEIYAQYMAGIYPAEGRPDWAKADAARAELKDTKFPKALLGPDDARLEVGAQLFEKLWKTYANPTAGFPDLTPHVNLAHYQALTHWELKACERSARLIAKRYIAGGGGGGTRSAGTAMRFTQLVAGVKTNMKPLGGDLYQGTVATYSTELGKEVERMKRALDDGWVVHARVLSGITGGGASRSEAEHSLIIYGYSGNAFEYFDPDVGGSNVAATGFDRLYYDEKARRLSTAETEAQLPVWGDRADTGEHARGFQVSGVHRYQVVSVETL